MSNLIDQDLEKYVVGAILCSLSRYLELSSYLRPQIFSNPNCNTIIGCLLIFFEREKRLPNDLIELKNEIQSRTHQDYRTFMDETISFVEGEQEEITIDRLFEHILKLNDYSLRRHMIDQGSTFVNQVEDTSKKLDDILSDDFAAKMKISQHFERMKRSVSDAGEIMDNFIIKPLETEKMENLSALAIRRQGVWVIDEITGGGQPKGNYTIIIGGTNSGKSIIAREYAIGRGIYQNDSVLILTNETPKKSVGLMLLVQHSGIGLRKIRAHADGQYRLTDDERKSLKNTSELFKEKKIFIEEVNGFTDDDTLRLMYQYAMRGVTLFEIDYLQNIERGNHGEDAVRVFSKKLQRFVYTSHLDVVGMSQVSRKADLTKRGPTIYDGAESSSLEKDADDMFLLDNIYKRRDFLPEIEKNTVLPGQIHLIYGKGRESDTNKMIKMYQHGDTFALKKEPMRIMMGPKTMMGEM